MNIDFLDESKIKYYIDKGKRKNLYIQIKDGNVIIKVPTSMSNKYMLEFVNKKKEWILENVQKFKENKKRNISYKNLQPIYVLGKKYVLNISKENIKRSKIKLDNLSNSLIIIIPNSISKFDEEDKVKALVDRYYKNIAQEEVMAAMEYLTHKTGLKPGKITIKNLSATWGICSSKNHISINQNLMMYSRKAIEYVCLHELCHLKYMNHSKDFWNLVEKYMPDYKLAKKELRE